MEPFTDQTQALRNVIAAQQKVIGAWEELFGSVEDTVLSLVKKNIDLKMQLLQQKDPGLKVSENVYRQMDVLKARYHANEISALAYFEGLDALLNAII